MSQVQNTAIIEALQAAAQRYEIKRLAAALNKAPSTVYAELNPWGDRQKAKVGLEDALEIMLLTGDFEALRLAAARCGFRLERVEIWPDKDLPGERLDDYGRLGEANRLIENKAHPNQVDRAFDEAIEDIEQTKKAYRRDWRAK